MPEQIFVKPAEGLKVRDEIKPNKILSEDGEFVPKSSYWLRRIKDGSVVKATQPKKASSTKTKAATQE